MVVFYQKNHLIDRADKEQYKEQCKEQCKEKPRTEVITDDLRWTVRMVNVETSAVVSRPPEKVDVLCISGHNTP